MAGMPTHLRAPANDASAGGFGGKHHGKSQSHMVSFGAVVVAVAVVLLLLAVVNE